MTAFLTFVALGLLALVYIFCSVTRECARAARERCEIERIPLRAPSTISEHRDRLLVFRPERSA